MTAFLHAGRALVVAALLGMAYLTVSAQVEPVPVKYIFPFEVVEKEGGYVAGDDLLTEVHFCILNTYDSVYYESITQSFVPMFSTGNIVFTNPVTGIEVDRASLDGHGVFYTIPEDGGRTCFRAKGVPKKIPEHLPTGVYELHFLARIEGKTREYHELSYKTEPVFIRSQ